MSIYIYMYTEGEREREGGRGRYYAYVITMIMIAIDPERPLFAGTASLSRLKARQVAPLRDCETTSTGTRKHSKSTFD